MNKTTHTTREAYLMAAVTLMEPIFTEAGATLPAVRVSTGWPSSRGTSSKRKAIGECWDKAAASDKVSQIFISPWLNNVIDCHKGDSMGVLPTLIHELCHGVLGSKAGDDLHKCRGSFNRQVDRDDCEARRVSSRAVESTQER